jgi:hypothetical protein
MTTGLVDFVYRPEFWVAGKQELWKLDVFPKNTIIWEWRRVAILRTNLSEEHVASIIRMKRINEIGKH